MRICLQDFLKIMKHSQNIFLENIKNMYHGSDYVQMVMLMVLQHISVFLKTYDIKIISLDFLIFL